MASGDAELRSNIKLILSQISRYPVIYTYPGTTNEASLRSQTQSGEVPIAAPGAVEMSNEQVKLLMRLYSGSPPKSQKLFPALLLSEISRETATVITQAVLQTGHLQHLEKALAGSDKQLSLEIRSKVWATIREALQMEEHRFSEMNLTRLEAMQDAELKRTPHRKLRKLPPPRL